MTAVKQHDSCTALVSARIRTIKGKSNNLLWKAAMFPKKAESLCTNVHEPADRLCILSLASLKIKDVDFFKP